MRAARIAGFRSRHVAPGRDARWGYTSEGGLRGAESSMHLSLDSLPSRAEAPPATCTCTCTCTSRPLLTSTSVRHGPASHRLGIRTVASQFSTPSKGSGSALYHSSHMAQTEAGKLRSPPPLWMSIPDQDRPAKGRVLPSAWPCRFWAPSSLDPSPPCLWSCAQTCQALGEMKKKKKPRGG